MVGLNMCDWISCSIIVTNVIRMSGVVGASAPKGGPGGLAPRLRGLGGLAPQGSRGVWGAAGPPMDGNLESEIGVGPPISDSNDFESDFESEFCPSDTLFLIH